MLYLHIHYNMSYLISIKILFISILLSLIEIGQQASFKQFTFICNYLIIFDIEKITPSHFIFSMSICFNIIQIKNNIIFGYLLQ